MLVEILCAIVGIFGLCYLYVKKCYYHWVLRGIVHDAPIFPHGSIKGVGTEFYRNVLHKRLYDKYKGKSPVVGMWTFLQPEVLIIDIDIIKNVLVRDFSSFVNRGIYHNAVDDPLSAGIFSLEDDQWRRKRGKIASTFTMGKIKTMFPTITQVADEFVKCVDGELEKGDEIECTDLLARFMVDVIGNVAFGVECNSLKNPEAEFREMGRKVFQVTKSDILKYLFLDANKGLARILRVTTTRKDVSDFFLGTVRETIAYREINKIQRNDLMNMLIKLKNEGFTGGDGKEGESKMTVNEIAAEVFLFFLAGFETSANALTFALYVLAQEQEIQEKGRQEIQDVLKKHGNQLNFESLSEMKYIGQILDGKLKGYFC